jgi:hypothetical protein
VGGLHLCHARLTGTQAFRERQLCQSESFPATTETIGKSQLRVNESPLLGRQSQEISRVTDNPTGAFQ